MDMNKLNTQLLEHGLHLETQPADIGVRVSLYRGASLVSSHSAETLEISFSRILEELVGDSLGYRQQNDSRGRLSVL